MGLLQGFSSLKMRCSAKVSVHGIESSLPWFFAGCACTAATADQHGRLIDVFTARRISCGYFMILIRFTVMGD